MLLPVQKQSKAEATLRLKLVIVIMMTSALCHYFMGGDDWIGKAHAHATWQHAQPRKGIRLHVRIPLAFPPTERYDDPTYYKSSKTRALRTQGEHRLVIYLSFSDVYHVCTIDAVCV